MIYLYWYLGIGLAALGLVYGTHRLTTQTRSRSLHELFEAVDPDREKLSFRILYHFVAPALAAILVVTIWPVAAYMKLHELLPSKRGTKGAGEQEFAVERQHLRERLTVEDIEMREVVTDPLGAVPEVPFGHLNAAWNAFLNGHSDGTELWSFSARSQTAWGGQELRSGYVMVRNGKPGAHFLTISKDVSDNDDAAVGTS